MRQRTVIALDRPRDRPDGSGAGYGSRPVETRAGPDRDGLRADLKQLVTRYAYALDTGGNNGYDFADLFTPDGEFIDPNAKGREQLAAFGRNPLMGPLNTIHYAMGLVLEADS